MPLPPKKLLSYGILKSLARFEHRIFCCGKLHGLLCLGVKSCPGGPGLDFKGAKTNKLNLVALFKLLGYGLYYRGKRLLGILLHFHIILYTIYPIKHFTKLPHF